MEEILIMKAIKFLKLMTAGCIYFSQTATPVFAKTAKSVVVSVRVDFDNFKDGRHFQSGSSEKLEYRILYNGQPLEIGSPAVSVVEPNIAHVSEDLLFSAVHPGETELQVEVRFSEIDSEKLEQIFGTSQILIPSVLQTENIVVENGRSDIYRLYNPNSGEHFYTVSATEKSYLMQAGWNDEGTAWQMPALSEKPVYRVYNPVAGDHHYTSDRNEVNALIHFGWLDEGIAFYNNFSSRTGIYRLYNPNASTGTHHFTKDAREAEVLKSLGWIIEENDWMPYSL